MNKNEWEQKLKEHGWPNNFGFKFDANDWGSCQYSSALAIFRIFGEMRKDLTQSEVLEILNISYEYDTKRNMSDIIDLLFNDFKDRRQHDKLSKKEIIDLGSEIMQLYSVDDIFNFLKRYKDLWDAAPYVINLVYKDFKISDVHDSPGFGPEGNVYAQSINFEIGIICAILYDNKIVRNEQSFANFDT